MVLRAAWYSRRGNNEKALDLLNRAVAVNSEFPETYRFRARIWERLGNPEAALVDYNQALLLNLPDGPTFLDRGLHLLSAALAGLCTTARAHGTPLAKTKRHLKIIHRRWLLNRGMILRS
jgi:tetratricopeptide (TPR) repeat protein